MPPLKPCIECGTPTDGTRCAEHRAAHDRQQQPKASSAARGYDNAWRKLSERARRIQPFCSVCGTDQDLTTDHSAEAWQAYMEGKPITLQMIDVKCRSHNAQLGSPFDHDDSEVGGSPQQEGPRPRETAHVPNTLRRSLRAGRTE